MECSYAELLFDSSKYHVKDKDNIEEEAVAPLLEDLYMKKRDVQLYGVHLV